MIPKRLFRPRPPRAAVVEDGAGLLGGRDPLAVEARDLVVDGARFRLRPMVPHGRDSAAPHAGDADRGGGEIVDAVFFIVCVCVGGFKSDTSSVRGSAESSSFGIHCGVTNLILVLPRSAPQQGPLVVLLRRRPGLGRCRRPAARGRPPSGSRSRPSVCSSSPPPGRRPYARRKTGASFACLPCPLSCSSSRRPGAILRARDYSS